MPPTPPPPPSLLTRSLSFLQRNFLTQLENLEHLASLQFLVLSRNRLTSLQGAASLPNLLALDVDHNALADIRTDELPPSLLYLNCAGNPFEDCVATYMRLFSDAELRTIDGLDEDAWLEQVEPPPSALACRRGHAVYSLQVEKELDEEERSAGQEAEPAPSGAAGAPVDNLEFLREVDAHQAVLVAHMKRAESLAQKMHEDAAKRRREARERAKDALLEAAAAEVAAANCQIDSLKREVALRLAAKFRPESALGEHCVEQHAQSGDAGVTDD